MDLHEIPRTGGAGWLSPAQQASYDTDYLEAKECHAARVRLSVIGVLAGLKPYCIGWHDGKLAEKMDCGDLLDTMGITDTPELIGKLFAASFDRECKADAFGEAEDMLAAYIDKTADLLAKREAAQS